jgi:cell division protein FtsQ
VSARAKTRKPSRTRASTAAGRRRASGRAGGRTDAGRKRATGRSGSRATSRATAKARTRGRGKASRRAPRKRAGPRRRQRRARRLPSISLTAGTWRRRGLLVLITLGALAAGYFGWLRDSALVAVRDVEVVGVSGNQKQRIEKALTKAAEKMTTLHVREDELAAAAAAFPDVKSVDADASPPGGLTVRVEQRRPALIARGEGEMVAVTGDGAVLPGVEPAKDAELPAIDVDELPASGRLRGPSLEQALIVGSAPRPLRPLIEKAGFEGEEGVVVTLEGGLPVHFGTGARAEAKWAAAAAVLADPKLKQLTYVDVRVPERAAAGGAAPPPPPEEEAEAPPDATSTEALPIPNP